MRMAWARGKKRRLREEYETKNHKGRRKNTKTRQESVREDDKERKKKKKWKAGVTVLIRTYSKVYEGIARPTNPGNSYGRIYRANENSGNKNLVIFIDDFLLEFKSELCKQQRTSVIFHSVIFSRVSSMISKGIVNEKNRSKNEVESSRWSAGTLCGNVFWSLEQDFLF